MSTEEDKDTRTWANLPGADALLASDGIFSAMTTAIMEMRKLALEDKEKEYELLRKEASLLAWKRATEQEEELHAAKLAYYQRATPGDER